jgi:hypothetical protein
MPLCVLPCVLNVQTFLPENLHRKPMYDKHDTGWDFERQDCWVSRRYTTDSRRYTIPRCLAAPHTQTQRHGVR